MRTPPTSAVTASFALALVGLGVALGAGRAGGPGARDSTTTVQTPGPAGATSGVTTGRVLALEAAIRELDLIKPGRPQRAPDFDVPGIDGKRFRLADHRGKAVLVNFWATWCPPCLEEMPALERLWQRNRQEAFVLVAVALDANTALVPPFASGHKLTFPVLLDPRMDVSNAYAVRALPTTVLIDRRGDVRAVALGPRVWDNDAAHALVRGLAR
jgi:peroxiredoxin